MMNLSSLSSRSALVLALAFGMTVVTPALFPRIVEAAPGASLSADRERFTDVNGKVYVRLHADDYYPVDGKGDSVDLLVISRVLAGGDAKAHGVRRDGSGVLEARVNDTRPFDPKVMGFGSGLVIPTARQASEMFFGVNFPWKLDAALGGHRRDANGEDFNPADRQWAASSRGYNENLDKADLRSIERWRQNIADLLKGTTKSAFDIPMQPGHQSTAYSNRTTFDEPAPKAWAQLLASAPSRERPAPRALAKGFQLRGSSIFDAAGKHVASVGSKTLLNKQGRPMKGDERASIIALFL